MKYQGEPSELIVGDNNIFREHCTAHIGTQGGGMVTRIGSNNLFMASTHVAHDCQVGDHVIMANFSVLGGHVVIEDGVRISGLAGVHQFARVGRNAFISGGTVVAQDVPPFMIADGDPARIRSLNIEGMKRNNIARETINALKEVFRLLYRSDLNRSQAIREIRQSDGIELPEVQEVLDFLDRSERGRLGRSGEALRGRSRPPGEPEKDPPTEDKDDRSAPGDAIAAGNGGDGDEDSP